MRINVSDPVFHIGELKSPKDYFPYQISNYLNNYIAFCKKNSVPSGIVDNIGCFKANIINCLFDYCSGQHTNAKFHLTEALNIIPMSEITRPLRDDILYRARKTKRKFFKLLPQKYSLDGMNHIPFELRYLVGNERYSFPGLPCLYFGASPEVCCLELSNYSKYLNIAQFSVNCHTDYRIIDFCFFDDYDFNNISDEHAMLFYSVWPLVAVCSFRYEDPPKSQKMNFRQDYIIPQLLLETIIDENAPAHYPAPCIGIRYYSARKQLFDLAGMCEDANKYINYAFPAQDIREQGTCNVLKSIFLPEKVVYRKDLITK